MQLSPYRALARFAAAAGAGGKIGSAQKENRKTPDGRPHAHAVQQKETSEPGARFASRLSLHVSGRCAHPAANAGGAAKRTCEPGARFASRLSPQCVRPMRTPRCKRGRCDKRDLRARGAMCVQAQPTCVRPMRTPRCKRGRCGKRDLRARGAMCVQAQPGRGEETRTPDILLPKQARYQLRYTSEKNCYLFYRLLRRKSRKSRRIRALRGKFPFSICSALFSISRSRFMVL